MSSEPQPKPPLSTKGRLIASGIIVAALGIVAWFAITHITSPSTANRYLSSENQTRFPGLSPKRTPDSIEVWQRSYDAASSSYDRVRPPRPLASSAARREQIRSMLQTTPQINLLPSRSSIPDFSSLGSLGPAEKPLKLSAEVLELWPSKDPDDADVWFYGVVKNTGEGALDHPRITVTMWNKGRTQQVGTAFGFTDRFVLSPNSVTSFRVLAQKAPPFAEATATVQLQQRRRGDRSGKLLLVSHTLKPSPPMLLLKGQVKNVDDKPLRFVKVIALARDKSGRPIGQTTAYAAATTLVPGATASFSTFFLLHRKPTHIDFDLEGSRTDQPPSADPD